MQVSNYKHQSWYVHFIVWIVPQQLFKYGNTWRFSTCAIESRGARLKRIARKVLCWRPISAAAVAYNYINRKTKERGHSAQTYKSSPMDQLMGRIAYMEESWTDATSVYARPEKMRLRQQLRSCKLKCEIADEVSVEDAVSMVQALRSKAEASSS